MNFTVPVDDSDFPTDSFGAGESVSAGRIIGRDREYAGSAGAVRTHRNDREKPGEAEKHVRLF